MLGDVATRGCHAAKSQAEGRAPNGITTAVAGSMVVRPARCNTVQLGCHCGVAGLLLGLRPVVVVGAFDVPLGHLALDDPWR